MGLLKDKKDEILKLGLEGRITNGRAAEALDISVRAFQYRKAKAKEAGETHILHGNRGRRPSCATPADTVTKILELYDTKYSGFTFSHFHEKLETEGILVSRATADRILRLAGRASPQRQRVPRAELHPLRARRTRFGELVQMDASEFDWFGDGETWSLHLAVDDATGTPLAGAFERQETTLGYYRTMRGILERHGIPEALYTDRRGVFSVNVGKQPSVEEQLAGVEGPSTEFGRVMEALGVRIILASSPQAKGRIERFNGIFQNRLSKEFRLERITSPKAAEDFLPGFFARYATRFAVEPSSDASAFVPLTTKQRANLDWILCHREIRRLSTNFEFAYHGGTYQLDRRFPCLLPIRRTDVTILEHPEKGIRAVLPDGTLAEVHAAPGRVSFQKTPVILSSMTTTFLRRANDRFRGPGWRTTNALFFDKSTQFVAPWGDERVTEQVVPLGGAIIPEH